MQDKTSNHAPIPTELNIAPRGKSWLHGELIDGEHGYPTRQSMENSERAAFEKWASFFGTWDVERDDDPSFSTTGYTDITVNVAWLAWQARAALAATPAAAPVVLPEPDFWVRPGATIHPDRGWQCWSNDGTATGAFHAETVRALLATATGLPAQAVLDYPWRDRLLDGRELVRDQQGFAEHPELPLLDEGMKPRAFFAALGVEMKHTMAEDDLSMDEYDAMNDAVNWSAWTPRPPIGEAWNLVAIFDTEDGPAAWWARAQKESRETAPQAQADARDAESDYQRGYRHGYNRRDAEVQGALL